MRKSESLQSFKEYRQSESQNPQQSSVHDDGTLLEYETLELRLHPPNVLVDNETYDDMTVVTIDSANRPGTLIEVVQTLTELNLSIRKARISSDGGWFVDEFFVSETPRGKVTDARKLNLIRQVLNVQQTDTPGANQGKDDHSMCAVFEIAGRDQKGLLASVMELLAQNACEAQSAAVWTYHNQVALVISVIDSHEVHNQHVAKQLLQQAGLRPGMPASMQPPLSMQQQQLLSQASLRQGLASAMQPSPINNHQPSTQKLQRLQGTLYDMLGGKEAHVTYEVVRCDTVHHERRLHHLLLLEELKSWQAQQLAQQMKARQAESEARAKQLEQQRQQEEQQQQQQQEELQQREQDQAASQEHDVPAAGVPASTATTSPLEATANGHAQQCSPASVSSTSPTTTPSAAPVPTSPQVSLPGSTSHTPAPSRDPSHHHQATSPRPAQQGTVPSTPSLTTSMTTSQLDLQGDGGAPWLGSGGNGAGSQCVRNTQGAPQTTTGGEKASSVVGPTPGGTPFVPAPTALLSHDLLNYSYLDPTHTSLTNLLRAEVTIQHSALLKYHLVTITCKDRNKLFFDTVCTLADMNYDVYHGTIDSKGDQASQLFYAKPRFGECMWDEKRARKLAYMLECAVQRRFPRGIRILMQAPARSSVPTIFSTLTAKGFWVTRAEIRSLCGGVVFDFSLTDAHGHIPSMAAVQKAFTEVGGMQAKELDSLMAVVSMGGVGAAAAAAAAWPPSAEQAAQAAGSDTNAAAASANANSNAATVATANLSSRPSLDLSRPIQMNIPQGKFTFAFAGSADKMRGPLQTSTSASLSQIPGHV